MTYTGRLRLLLLPGLAVATLACSAGGSQSASLPTPITSSAPQPGPDPEVRMPGPTRHMLSNGLEVWIVERHRSPLVVARLTLKTGTAVEGRSQAGLAAITAEMLRWGTSSRSGLEISDELDFLAAGFGTVVGYESSALTINTLERTLPEALEIYADALLRSTFPEVEFERVRQERLAALRSSRDSAYEIADELLRRLVFGDEHPYGWAPIGTPESLSALNIEDLRTFHRTYYRPNNGTMVVLGAATADRIIPMLEEAFGSWQPAELPAPRGLPVPDLPERTRIYLVDKPGAPQSEISMGHPGPPRSTDDYLPLTILGRVLGGTISSRLYQKLRYEKGYTYGAWGSFEFRRGPGLFVAGAAVQTEATSEAVAEFVQEIQAIREGRPVTLDELEAARAGILRSEPLNLQTAAQIQGRYQEVVQFGLPPDYFDDRPAQLRAVTLTDVHRVALEHLHPDRMAIVIVGDRATIEAPLQTLGLPMTIVEARE